MRRCLDLAQKGKSYAAPNPLVGAVLVHNERIIGEGFHKQFGEAHAEVNALNSVTEKDRKLIPESTLFVTLEPCAHHGKTPPCALRIIEEGIKKVVVCNDDPFPKVDGRGYALLENAGVTITKGVLEKEGRWLNRRFFCAQELQRPYVILKWAQTADGFIAPKDGSRFQISNKHSRLLVHKWRTEEAAILVGTRTALNDDPQLTARLWKGKQPVRILIDRKLSVPSSSEIFGDDANTMVVNELKNETQNHVRFASLKFDESLVSSVLQMLHQQNIQSVIVEGGAATLQHFFRQNLWDEARIFTAPFTLKMGIQVPSLTNATLAFSTAIGDDLLSVFTNADTPFPYQPEMEL